jgi:hypothetical protein
VVVSLAGDSSGGSGPGFQAGKMKPKSLRSQIQ